ncbi:hypothetical protein L861_13630 [Litchfieldella anticariensis FP35 = DSM 16096]|uniref:Uncharacterized protein n=1 Tax=Litchfieldella anticariensis (strain DSM 16096 / CECT 5854 / CIP 108499 / LMG 22089 / FP35) TaxID=1121939 RepID=S2L7V5_LITA3|nr:hypothetical protein [Halomonas anticariensis]EPC00826.1 hypothetical protein L861_13630 [Halomonas anticariensis FP35 = DSM 16096]
MGLFRMPVRKQNDGPEGTEGGKSYDSDTIKQELEKVAQEYWENSLAKSKGMVGIDAAKSSRGQ